MTDRPSQHRSVTAETAAPVAADRRPQPGPITILPGEDEVFASAVLAGGGRLTQLSDETRGLIWLTYGETDRLVEFLHDHPRTGWVQLPYAGVDAFADVLARFAGTTTPLWTSAKGAYAQPVAEHALTLVLALLRVLPKRVLATSWAGEPKEGTSLFGLNVLIVGAGGIAIELIRLLEPFGVHVTVVRRSTTPVAGAERTVSSEHLLQVLPAADVVVIAAAFTDSTRRLIGAPELAAMKGSAVLVNIARGGLVDTDALTAALADGAIAGAGLDVTDPEPLPDGHPLWTEERVIITPHSADTPEMTAPLLAERITENVRAFLGDGRFVGVVDPEAGY
ncbi:MAG TPA: D-isomer specific 2-hydroxyacid dehydrogenase family protein [Lacisediminihabitans sp.]|uniref:D-isomer specific 2-hydroxyacid dehydrogenase family protein n=1 Tax=Lacisediminihabitans sp. TaxID=2787631 RepID=UPI002ED8786B